MRLIVVVFLMLNASVSVGFSGIKDRRMDRPVWTWGTVWSNVDAKEEYDSLTQEEKELREQERQFSLHYKSLDVVAECRRILDAQGEDKDTAKAGKEMDDLIARRWAVGEPRRARLREIQARRFQLLREFGSNKNPALKR